MANQIHILLVDDDVAILRLISSQLAAEGFEVIQAHDGNEGREMARRFQPDLILMDVRMPVMDGYKTLVYMKHEEVTKKIPVLFLTNEDFSIEGQKAAKEIGAEGYLPKSGKREDMIAKVKEVLTKYGHELPTGPVGEVGGYGK
jgi:DNA-binding response OmpR family regulator